MFLFSVINRSEEAWGPLAKCDDKTFNKLITTYDAKTKIKDHLKKQKKLKTFRVQFLRESRSEYFTVQAENEYGVSSAARELFKQNKDTITFKERETAGRIEWADSNIGYDRISYVKVS